MSTCKHMLRFMLYIISAWFILCKNWLARPSGKKEGNKKAFFHYPYYVFVDRFKLAQPLVSLVIPFTLFKQITFNTIIRKKKYSPNVFFNFFWLVVTTKENEYLRVIISNNHFISFCCVSPQFLVFASVYGIRYWQQPCPCYLHLLLTLRKNLVTYGVNSTVVLKIFRKW